MPLHRGKIATNPEVLEVRPLTREDLSLLGEARGPDPSRAGSGAIAKLREPHHRLARLIAAGIRGEELSARSGYSPQRIHTLQLNTAFKELIATYRDKIDEAFVRAQDDYFDALAYNRTVAERMITEKLEIHEDEGTLPPMRELIAISRDGADRTGYGKRNTTINANAEMAQKIEDAISRVQKLRTVNPVEAAPIASANPGGAALGKEGRDAPAVVDLPPSQFLRRA